MVQLKMRVIDKATCMPWSNPKERK